MTSTRKILCPIDYSEPSLAVLELAVKWAQHFGAELWVLHVVSGYSLEAGEYAYVPLPETSSELSAGQVSYAELMSYVKRYVPKDLEVHAETRVGATAHEIVEMAGAVGIDLIMLSTHGRTGWRHALLGSVAEAVVRTAPCPVLTFGPTCQKIEDLEARTIESRPVAEAAS